ncbi:hypothetical protein PhaeoP14_03770 (plasmid) [Phaeobacter piscinae]|nr:hypothetical protein PhaeoP14_03770 [Phaeobacter piscinae]
MRLPWIRQKMARGCSAAGFCLFFGGDLDRRAPPVWRGRALVNRGGHGLGLMGHDMLIRVSPHPQPTT